MTHEALVFFRQTPGPLLKPEDHADDGGDRDQRRVKDGASAALRAPLGGEAGGEEFALEGGEVRVGGSLGELRAAPEHGVIALRVVPLRGGGAEPEALADGDALVGEIFGRRAIADGGDGGVKAKLGQAGLRWRATTAQKHGDPVVDDRLRSDAGIFLVKQAARGLGAMDEAVHGVEKFCGRGRSALLFDEPGMGGLERGEIGETDIVRRLFGGRAHGCLRSLSSSVPTLRSSSQRLLSSKSTS